MKSDLDRFMADDHLDALLIVGAAAANPSMAYMVGRAHITGGIVLKRRGDEPVLFYRPMERDEAAGTGLKVKCLDDYGPLSLLKEAGGDQVLADAFRYRSLIAEYGVTGRVGILGRVELGPAYGAFQHLTTLVPDVEILGLGRSADVVSRARGTKDSHEIERIRRIAHITTSVVGDVAGFLTSHRVRQGVLEDSRGEVLTVGEVKRRINLWLAMRGADNPEGTIFAVGRDAGVPHSVGGDDDPVVTGKTIVFDIFPCEAGGGYFYDFTRTWCLDHASDEILQAFEDVRAVQQEMLASLRTGKLCREYQARTCELFEARGHPTIHTDPRTELGYVHSLGHGVGLEVQETPTFQDVETNTDRLAPGSVVTVEPGLYYPDRGFGIRLEDTVCMSADGTAEVLAPYPDDLVLKVMGA
jgi:Xaa-Pro aminopeptidase